MTSNRKRPEPRTATGNWNPDWESFARLDPAWAEKAVSMSIAPTVSGVLESKTVEFIGIAANAAGSRFNGPGVRRHIGNAVSAALIARPTSLFVPCWKRPTTSRVSAGLRLSNVSPDDESHHSPAMK